MKKLMTMLAAVATAFGLYAADSGFISGAGFDTSDTAQPANGSYTWLNNTELAPNGFVSSWWSSTEGATWMEGVSLPQSSDNRPAQFVGDKARLNDGYVAIQTQGAGLVGQYVNAGSPKRIDADNGLYFDGLVQFTAFDEAPANVDANAKIAVFPMLNNPDDDSAGVSLWVKAFGGTNLWKTVALDNPNDWHRVTIKMINNIMKAGKTAQAGFVVYVDGVAVECTDAMKELDEDDLTPEAKSFWNKEQLFGSLVANTAEITDVAFGGKGAIDEIAFTETAPDFAVSPIFCKVTGDTGIASFVADGQTWDGENDIDAKIENGKVVVTAVTAANGYFIPADKVEQTLDATKGGTVTVSGAKTLGATVKISGQDDQYFENAAAAIAELSKVTSATTATLELNADSGALTIDNAFLTLTIDLAGKKIASVSEEVSAIVVNAGKLTIIDSDGNGVVQGVDLQDGSFSSALALPEEPVEGTVSLAINGGTFFGSIDYTTEDNTTIALDGAKFDAGSNTDPSDDSCLVGGDIGEGNEWVLADSFWSVQEIQKIDIKDAVVTASATYGATAPTVTVTLNEQPIDPANYDATSDYTSTTAAGTKITVTVTAKGDTYTGTASGDFTVEKQALTVSVSLDVTEATFDAAKTAPGDYATPTITGLDGVDAGEYTAAWNPTEVTAEGGEFTYTVTAKQDGNYTFEPASATLTIKKAEPEYPEDWPEADDDVKEAFKAWKAENPGADLSDPLMQNRFLLNLAATAEVPELEITSIVVEGTTATIKVAAGEIDLDQINGVIFVETSENLSTWTPTAVTGEVTEKVWTGSVTAPFIKAKVGFKVPK